MVKVEDDFRKKYSKRSNLLSLICFPLMLLSIIIFITSYLNNVHLVVIAFQWTVVTFILSIVYKTISESEYELEETTRKEEFIFLTGRLILILPVLIYSFSSIQSKWGGIVSMSSVLVILTLTLLLDKSEINIIIRTTKVE